MGKRTQITDAMVRTYIAIETHGTVEKAAAALGVSPNTVKSTLYDLRRLVGVESTFQLAPILRERGYIAA